MTEKCYAVIDLGTNTFHLLIVAVTPERSFREVFRERKFVKIGIDGVDTLSDAALERGYSAMADFKLKLDEFDVQRVCAFGTAALRTASNGQHFIDQVQQRFDIAIELISGDREALLIHKGVSEAVPLPDMPVLIMDIGGGSVEFIIAQQAQVLWEQSFPIGASVLYQRFHQTDPIPQVQIEALFAFLTEICQPLLQQLKKYKITHLIGASGTFDVVGDVLEVIAQNKNFVQVAIDSFPSFLNRVVPSNLEQRLAMTDIPDSRADLIVVALLLIDFILDQSDFKSIYVSHFAMKEGMLAEMINEEEI